MVFSASPKECAPMRPKISHLRKSTNKMTSFGPVISPSSVSDSHSILLPPATCSVPGPLADVNLTLVLLNSGSAAVAMVDAIALSATRAVMVAPMIVSLRMFGLLLWLFVVGGLAGRPFCCVCGLVAGWGLGPMVLGGACGAAVCDGGIAGCWLSTVLAVCLLLGWLVVVGGWVVRDAACVVWGVDGSLVLFGTRLCLGRERSALGTSEGRPQNRDGRGWRGCEGGVCTSLGFVRRGYSGFGLDYDACFRGNPPGFYGFVWFGGFGCGWGSGTGWRRDQ